MNLSATSQTTLKEITATSSIVCAPKCEANNRKDELSCKLTSAALRLRKETIIKSLKEQVLVKKELKNGYSYKFAGTDKMLDELTEFIKTERDCCDFFIFTLSVKGDKSETWLKITGPGGVKDFLKTELEM